MKPNILLAGVTGYIGKYLIESIKDEGILYTLSKYPKEKEYQEIIWLEKDIYNYNDVLTAMDGIDIAIFYLDPTKHSAKLTHATARDINLIAADNLWRAAAKQGVSKIIYISRSRFDVETKQRLSAYGTEVEETTAEVARPHVAVELQTSKYDDVRSALSIQLPMNWTLRSEEHTSELQSRFDLVCRLLLEKKKNNISNQTKITGIISLVERYLAELFIGVEYENK